MKKAKKIPVFKNDDEERAFWNKNDASDYVDWSTSEKVVFNNLKTNHKNHLTAFA